MRQTVGQRARALIEERFAWPRIAEQLETHLYDAVQHSTGRVVQVL